MYRLICLLLLIGVIAGQGAMGAAGYFSDRQQSNGNTFTVEDDFVPPATPTGLVATPGDTQVSLNWNDNVEGDLAGYNVYRSQTSGGPYTKVNGSLVLVSNYTDTGLTNGVTYYYVVTAVDTSDNESGDSNEASATTVDLPPVAPTGLVATPGDTQAELNWNDNTEGDLAGYNVYRSQTSGGPYTKVNGSLVLVSNYKDTGLTNGITYYYVVTAVDTPNNESGDSNETSSGYPILLDDDFEDVDWDNHWDGNGVTSWNKVESTPVHSGSQATQCKKNANGPFTTDNLYTSEAANITISFWFRPTSLEAGDILIQIYNGTTYNTFFDITTYSTYADSQWCYFSEVITDPQYFKSNFKLRFEGSAVADPNDLFILDDVLIEIQR